MNTKNLYILLLALLMPLCVVAQEKEQITIPLSDPGNPGILEVGVVHGSISVQGYDGGEVLISYINKTTNKYENTTRNGLKRIPNTSIGLEARERNNEVKVDVSAMSKTVDLEIRVPREFSLKLSTVNNGDISVENINGQHEISNVNGDVNLSNIRGSALVSTVNGDISVSFSELDENSPMSYTTVNGDIDFSVPASAAFDVKIKSEWGDIFSDFEFEIKRGNSNKQTSRDSGTYKVTVDKWINGSINGGGPEYLFKTLHGDIIIRKR